MHDSWIGELVRMQLNANEPSTTTRSRNKRGPLSVSSIRLPAQARSSMRPSSAGLRKIDLFSNAAVEFGATLFCSPELPEG
jgi:hypothetical protein